MNDARFEEHEPVAAFARRFHFGVQGITATAADTRAAIEALLRTGWAVRAFDTELVYLDLVQSMLPPDQPVHVPISYPMGNTTLNHKLHDVGLAAGKGVRDVCVALDYRAVLSRRWNAVQQEVAQLEREFGAHFSGPGAYLAYILPAQLMTPPDIVAACHAIGEGGGRVIKVNPGAKLEVQPGHIGAIFNAFGHARFDVHPSGGIRNLDAALGYLRMGCTTIHSRSALQLIGAFAQRRQP